MRIDWPVTKGKKEEEKSARVVHPCAWLQIGAGSAVGDVHRDLKTEAKVGESGGGPLHSQVSKSGLA
jgi:hypothetical protein